MFVVLATGCQSERTMVEPWWGAKLATPNGLSLSSTTCVSLVSDDSEKSFIFQVEPGTRGCKLSALHGMIAWDTGDEVMLGSLFGLAVLWPWGDSDPAQPGKVYAGLEYHFIVWNLQFSVGGLCQLRDSRDWVLSAGVGFWPCKF
jgi:hypothetical protein